MHETDRRVNPPPTARGVRPLPAGYSDERYELGDGRLDHDGDASRADRLYRVADHDASGERGIILDGPFRFPPREEPALAAADPLELLAETIAHSRIVGEITSALVTAAVEADHADRFQGSVLIRQLVEDVLRRAPRAEARPARPDRIPTVFEVIELAPASVS